MKMTTTYDTPLLTALERLGPHDHQSLLHPAKQLEILDAFGNLHPVRESFAALVRRRQALQQEKSALIVDEKTYAEQLDVLRFQTHEITAARLQADEEEQLQENYRRASNAAKLLELARTALRLLSEEDVSLLTQAGALGRTLRCRGGDLLHELRRRLRLGARGRCRSDSLLRARGAWRRDGNHESDHQASRGPKCRRQRGFEIGARRRMRRSGIHRPRLRHLTRLELEQAMNAALAH